MCFVDEGGAGISRLDVDSSIAVVQEGEKLGLAGQAVESKGVILQGMVRDSYDRDPPLIAIDATTRRLLWVAEDPRRIGGSSGNIRSQPAIVGGQAIIATAYSNSICAVSMTDGTVTWRIPVGREMYAQYSSPVARGDVVYIGRQDGYLHKVSCGKQRREWSMFLGDPENAGAVVSASQPLPELDEEAAWSTISAPIVSTPTLDGDRLYVGTNDGYLYCIGSLGDDLDPHSQLPRRDSL
jgi:outer membrane protein assembly factor BamB